MGTVTGDKVFDSRRCHILTWTTAAIPVRKKGCLRKENYLPAPAMTSCG